MPKKYRQYPSVEEINSLVDYDPNTGVFTHKRRHVIDDSRYSRSWNTRFSGKSAGVIGRQSMYLSFNNVKYKSHRIAMIISGIDIAGKEIDHINRDFKDNRMCNLRIATSQENMCNRIPSKLSKTGYMGVKNYNSKNKFMGIVGNKGGKELKTKIYDNAIDAAMARDVMVIKKVGDFAVLNFPRSLYMFVTKSP